MTAPRLYLVEDSDADAEAIARSLRGREPAAQVRRLRTVREAREALRDRGDAPDLVLLDLNLPDDSGMALLTEIRRDAALDALMVVVLTGSSRQSEVDAAYAAGAQGFVTKPMGLPEMRQAMTTVMDYWFGVLRRPAVRA